MIWIKILVLILGFAITIISITYNESKKRHVIIAVIGVFFIVLSTFDIYEAEKEKNRITLDDLNFSLFLTGTEKATTHHSLDRMLEMNCALDGSEEVFPRTMSFMCSVADSIKFKIEFECITTTSIDSKYAKQIKYIDKNGEEKINIIGNDSILKESYFAQRSIHYMKDSKGYISNMDDLDGVRIELKSKVVMIPKNWVFTSKLKLKGKTYNAEVEDKSDHIISPLKRVSLFFNLD